MNGDHHPVGSPSAESGRAKIDFAELRQKAEAATKGWTAELNQPYARHPRIYDADGRLIADVGNADNDEQDLWEANAAYIVAAQPSTVLALLDRIEELEGAVRDIAEATDPDNPESYRCDDREGCLDTVNAIARKALSGEKP